MADKLIGELPGISYLDSGSLFVAEQNGQAVKVSGKQLTDFANVETEEKLVEIRQKASQAEISASNAVESATAAASSERNAKSSEINAKASEESAKASKIASKDSETAAQNWAEFAQAQAESVTVPAAEGVYNIVIQDRVVTDNRYALIVENGVLKLLCVKNTVNAATPTLIDNTSGVSWKLAVENGRLLIEEV